MPSDPMPVVCCAVVDVGGRGRSVRRVLVGRRRRIPLEGVVVDDDALPRPRPRASAREPRLPNRQRVAFRKFARPASVKRAKTTTRASSTDAREPATTTHRAAASSSRGLPEQAARASRGDEALWEEDVASFEGGDDGPGPREEAPPPEAGDAPAAPGAQHEWGDDDWW
mmetsp:Transcript_8916/g.36829  ORF Transcript_8916/g.36829 Transcript_8916/m.36829 type:complete len:169 (-) Transcript_8916:54-560(-)